MMRTAPYFGILGALLLASIVSIGIKTAPSTRTVPPKTATSSAPAATSTLLVIPSLTGGVLALEKTLPSLATTGPAQEKASETNPTSTPQKADTAQKPETTAPAQNPESLVPNSSVSLSFDSAASTLRGALVNVICYAPAGSGFRSSSGSGVVIDPRGIILTNAHVAAPFLLKNKGVSCVIRTGSPAQEAYTAKLMFISPTWVANNAAAFATAVPSGTGEYDYAFLAITGSATTSPKPSFFSAIPLSQNTPSTGEGVAIASYAAQFLESSQIQSALFPTIVFGSIKDVFTFATNAVDVIALGGSAAAQEGSSGGGVVSESGQLIGIITTSTVTGDTSTRNVNAITATYIRRSYQGETGSTLESLLSQDPLTSVDTFTPKVPGLEATILANLSH